MMALSMRDEQFKAQLFRFVDVLPSLRRSGEIVEHLEEYFGDLRDGFAPLVHTGVRLARIAPWVSGRVLRWNISGMARQFIAGKNPHDVMKMLRKRRAQKIGAFINFDMESYAHKNTTLELFKKIFTEGEFKDWPHAGIVIQAYLRDSEADLRDLIDWGRERGARFAVRLVKGAYWDYETIKSRQNGWDCPVYFQKPESDV